jgi:predicted TIM-barrel fold metal-dependent hydrolase
MTLLNSFIIDSHGHLGWTYKNGEFINYDNDYFYRMVPEDENPKVRKILVSSFSGLYKDPETRRPIKDEIDCNMEIMEFCKRDKRLFPSALCQPGFGWAENIERLLFENKGVFKALKFHPSHLELDASDVKYFPYMELASKYNLPCVFHIALGEADPEKIYSLAKHYPQIPVVLFHMNLAPEGKVGQQPLNIIKNKRLEGRENLYCWDVREHWNRDGINVVKSSLINGDANLYLEISWTKAETVVEAIKEVGSERVIFGTDCPYLEQRNGIDVSYRERIEEVLFAIRTGFTEQADDIIEKVFHDNSEKLFFSN